MAKLNSGTLVESVIAVLIISVVVMISLECFIAIMNTSTLENKLKSTKLFNNVCNSIRQGKDFRNIESQDFQIEVSANKLEGFENLFQLELIFISKSLKDSTIKKILVYRNDLEQENRILYSN